MRHPSYYGRNFKQMKNIKYPLLLLILFGFTTSDFKEQQLKYKRVRTAYAKKGSMVAEKLKALEIQNLEIYIRVFKNDDVLELWGKDRSKKKFTLIKNFEICSKSGKLGPKRKQGDYQVPEGYYHIDRFNPWSNFHLSLGINYPNRSDRILGVRGKLGGDIFIHGACVTIGCVPITDDKIRELYIYCVEAKNDGQKTIPVTIFPTKLTTINMKTLKNNYANDTEKLNLWSDLKNGFDSFNENRTLPSVSFLANGRHAVK